MEALKDELVFNYDWLSLDKNDLELISYLLLNGNAFVGSLSELCRALGRSVGTRSRNGRQQSIDNLHTLGIIEYTQKTTRTFEMTLIFPKESEKMISIERQNLESIMRRQYDRSVAWQHVLKVYLWIKSRGSSSVIFVRSQIATELNVGVSTITEATRVLNDYYGAIAAQRIGYVDDEGRPRCCGQEAQLSAFWLKD